MTNNREKLKKFAEENGLDTECVFVAAERLAVCKAIEKIVFRAETALYTELSLVYDDLSLTETPEERLGVINGKLAHTKSALNALVNVANFCVKEIMEGRKPAVVPVFFHEVHEVEKSDDDEVIAEFLMHCDEESAKDPKKVLREYVAREFEEGDDEH